MYRRALERDFKLKFQEIVLRNFANGKSRDEITELMQPFWGEDTSDAINAVFGNSLDLPDLEDDDKERVRTYVRAILIQEKGTGPSLNHFIGGDLKELGYTAGQAFAYYSKITPFIIKDLTAEVQRWKRSVQVKKVMVGKREDDIKKPTAPAKRIAFILKI